MGSCTARGLGGQKVGLGRPRSPPPSSFPTVLLDKLESQAAYLLEPPLRRSPLFQGEVGVKRRNSLRKQKGVQRRNLMGHKREPWLPAGARASSELKRKRVFDEVSRSQRLLRCVALDGELVSAVWGWGGMPASSQLPPSLVLSPFAAGALDPAASRQVCLLLTSSCSRTSEWLSSSGSS